MIIQPKMPTIGLEDVRNGGVWQDAKKKLSESGGYDYNKILIDELNSYSLMLKLSNDIRKMGNQWILWSKTYKSLESFTNQEQYILLKPVIPSQPGFESQINLIIKLLASVEYTIERHLSDKNPDNTVVLKTKKDVLKTLSNKTLPEFLLFDIWYLMFEYKYVNVIDFFQYSQNMNHTCVMYFASMIYDNKNDEIFPGKFANSFINSNMINNHDVMIKRIYYTRCVFNWISVLKNFTGNRFNADYINQFENIFKIIENDTRNLRSNVMNIHLDNINQVMLQNDMIPDTGIKCNKLIPVILNSIFLETLPNYNIGTYDGSNVSYYGIVNGKGELFGLFSKEQIHKIVIIVSKLVMTGMVSMYVINNTIKITNKYIKHITNYMKINTKEVFNHFNPKDGTKQLFCTLCCVCFVWHPEHEILNGQNNTTKSSFVDWLGLDCIGFGQ